MSEINPTAPQAEKPASARPESRPSSSGGPRSGGRPGGGFRPGGSAGGPGGRPQSGPGGRRGRPLPRRKVCRFCAEKTPDVDYKAIPILRGFLTARGKILGGRTTGNCAGHQRQLTRAIKLARTLALLPYTGE